MPRVQSAPKWRQWYKNEAIYGGGALVQYCTARLHADEVGAVFSIQSQAKRFAWKYGWSGADLSEDLDLLTPRVQVVHGYARHLSKMN